MKKKIIWDLFGGGQNSVYLTLKENKLLSKFEIYTFDVTSPIHDNQFHIDLSQKNIIEIFKKFPKPNIIIASPLCQSFSNVLNMKGGGTCFWKLNSKKNKLIERSVKEFNNLKSGFTKNLKADVQLFIKRLGKKCIDNTIDLIMHYKPEYWYIENPKQSLIWKYITLNRKDFCKKNNYYLNEASYGKYGFLTTKSTIFMSNVKMDLKKGKIDPPYYVKEINGSKYYVLKDDNSVKLRRDLDSRMLGIASLNKIIRARKVKSGMGGMDFVQRNNVYKQINKKSNEQICEGGPASAIPHKLIKHIFKIFENNYIKNSWEKSINELISISKKIETISSEIESIFNFLRQEKFIVYTMLSYLCDGLYDFIDINLFNSFCEIFKNEKKQNYKNNLNNFSDDNYRLQNNFKISLYVTYWKTFKEF